MNDNPPQRSGRDRTGVSSETVLLGSRSPRRLELLSSIVPRNHIVVRPPLSPEELQFEDADSERLIEDRLRCNVGIKLAGVRERQRAENDQPRTSLAGDGPAPGMTPTDSPNLVTGQSEDGGIGTRLAADDCVVLVADTIVIATTTSGRRIVLGQPCPDHWQEDVRDWFRRLLSGRTHSVWTCFHAVRGLSSVERIVRTEVTFHDLSDELIGWYVRTGESPGKAGGYAIQGHGAALVSGLRGSLTNVIGLPTLEVAEALRQLGVANLFQVPAA